MSSVLNRRQLLLQSSLIGSALACRPLFAASSLLSDPVAPTSNGPVRGYYDQGLLNFRGIPYGDDTGATRFAAPRPPVPWTGVRDCLIYGPRAPQNGNSTSNVHGYQLPLEQGSISEDCLHLNVITPALKDGHKRPVLVYIHGGGYSGWSANNELYNGVHLARQGDVVVVTLNHRLNLFGYLYLAGLAPGFEDSGNAGMLDLVLALEWVRDNIEGFGGDPKRVLVFGQSGGGAKCATLMAMPQAAGLFQRVLTMSGQQLTAMSPDKATARAQALLAALALPASRMDELRTLPMAQLLEAAQKLGSWAPVRDGRTLLRDPFAPDAPPLSAAIPMILGNTHDETRFFYPQVIDDPTLTWQTLGQRLEGIRQFLGPLDREQVVRFYRKLYPAYGPADVFVAATTAFRSWRSQLLEAERRAAQPAAQAHTWVYELDWASPLAGGRFRAPHTLDIPLFFANTSIASGMTGDLPEARLMALVMSQTLLTFATSGDPNHSGLPDWQPYDLTSRQTMCFNLPPRLINDPRGEERRLIEQVPYAQP